MTNRTRLSASAAVVALTAFALPLAGGTALAETVKTHEKEVVFDAEHPCTKENVIGDTRVKMTITTTEHDDGTTTVETVQHTHGQQLYGVISQDWYTFNNAEDVRKTETIFGSSGTAESKTQFIHTDEDIANLEVPGEDDFHQKLDIVISPLLPPVVVKDTGRCQ